MPTSPPPPLSTVLIRGPLRRGKWTSEEEEYAAAVIQQFVAGVLPIQYGTTLRGYIAQLLHCDPMRVSKKLIPGSVFVGLCIDPKLGRRSFYPRPIDTPGLAALQRHAEQQLAQLRGQFIASVEREERSQQDAVPRSAAAYATSLQLLSSLSSVVERADDQPLASGLTMYGVDPQQRKSLPSLSDLMRQNRLRIPCTTQPAATTMIHNALANTWHSPSMNYS